MKFTFNGKTIEGFARFESVDLENPDFELPHLLVILQIEDSVEVFVSNRWDSNSIGWNETLRCFLNFLADVDYCSPVHLVKAVVCPLDPHCLGVR